MKPKLTILKSLLLSIIVSLAFISGCVQSDSVSSEQQSHPSLILTKTGIDNVKAGLGNAPKFDESLANTIALADNEIAKGFDVPVPKGLAGGYSHGVHKQNFFMLEKAGNLFQITGDEKYAIYIRDMFLEYAKLFPTYGRHPATRSYAPGKFFWQSLNDANWLVYTSQAYDCIYDWLDTETRNKLNKELFRPMADFLSTETPQFFNRIHNHSTWGNAAVGMIGLVMDDDELVQRALYGLDTAEIAAFIRDNDGGSIRMPDQDDAGFLAQIDHSFSPDGYYTEGPYYQRYAIYPFLIFAQALHNRKPELKIFEYRDGVLIKGVYSLLEQTNKDGEFFPINDAMKGMSVLSRELITAVSLAYQFGGEDKALLPYVALQDRVPLNETGMTAALALKNFTDFNAIERNSIEIADGANGDEGALGILRNTKDGNEVSVIMKYTKQGMGHGHFDKLSFFTYLNGEELYQDYGSARWVNIEQKDGGRYLKENRSWAKQTIAHNTVTINKTSQYEANTQEADKHHSDPYLFIADSKDLQVMSAKENNAYEGVAMQRSMALINLEELDFPLLLDIYRIDAKERNLYDLPFYFQGHVMSTNFEYSHERNLSPMGNKFGYQHIWKEASGKTDKPIAQMSWFNGSKFFTISSATEKSDSLLFVRLGANDSEYHLRRDGAYVIRRLETASTTFANVLEIHGSYSPITEIGKNTYSSVQEIKVVRSDDQYSVVKVELKDTHSYIFVVCNNNSDKNTEHKLVIDQQEITWTGPIHLLRDNN